MRMKQQPLFPGMMREPSKPVIPTKEECEVLYYGRYIDDDTIIFIEKERAEYNAEIHTAMAKAEKAGLTWGEFKEKYPKVFNKVWGVLESCELTTFEEWLKEKTRGRRQRPQSQPEETPAAKDEYMKIMKWERMPLLEEPFDGQVVLEHAPSLAAPYDGSVMLIPTEITDEFGEVQEGFSVDPYVTFRAEDVKKVTRAFRKHGYLCKRNDRIVEKAMGIV